MTYIKDNLQSIVESVWSTMLGAELTPGAPVEVKATATADQPDAAFVEVSGAWEGRITVRLSPGALDSAVTSLLGLSPEEASEEERLDVLKELANMVGGNLKAMMNQPTRLSVPLLDGTESPQGLQFDDEERISLRQNDLPVEITVSHRGSDGR
jgi:chemotaxis protein CheX